MGIDGDCEAAAAKINLTLHVTGQRADGYHLLDSVVVFAELGDVIHAHSAPALSLQVTGPMAGRVPMCEDNLVCRAARLIDPAAPYALTLEKHLPVASGIGGGSADAAATLRLLARLGHRPLPDKATLVQLGADVPVCLAGRPTRMRGIGEVLSPVPALPPLWLVLVNPGVAVPTPQVFKTLASRQNPPMPDIPKLHSATNFAAWLATQRNDLQAAAIALEPVIAAVLAGLQTQPACLLARMSGSGATCFGLFATRTTAQKAASALAKSQPSWWVAATQVQTDQDERLTT